MNCLTNNGDPNVHFQRLGTYLTPLRKNRDLRCILLIRVHLVYVETKSIMFFRGIKHTLAAVHRYIHWNHDTTNGDPYWFSDVLTSYIIILFVVDEFIICFCYVELGKTQSPVKGDSIFKHYLDLNYFGRMMHDR
ncbi:hypothetical protein BRADI_5g08865v3 [Brachypodium distachyon]|uniref:Uncharacterized protein n=1 Tax=Brachypodium distachyon TaxID=15368 RepID=A0A0Q3KQY2_BRADI|nr:hypothetical protein BRADI_5g08865v3 [Brachypodium distachyon]